MNEKIKGVNIVPGFAVMETPCTRDNPKSPFN
jgi:hypothetical protein